MEPLSYDELLALALQWAQDGIKVFPVGSNKKPLPGSHGFLDASSDLDVVRAMPWRAATGLAMPTGDGTYALDVDLRTGGIESLNSLVAVHAPLPRTLVHQTGGGGLHYFFDLPAGVRVPISVGRLGPGLDIRCDGGYVVLPGSLWRDSAGQRPDGVYSVLDANPKAPIPEWLLAISPGVQRPGETKPKKIYPLQVESAKFNDGTRNSSLLSRAGKLRRAGLPYEEIVSAITAINLTHCDPPLEQDEVDNIVRSSERYRDGDPKPNTVPTEPAAPKDISPSTEDEWAIAERHEVKWVLKPLLVAEGVTLISGPPKSTKTSFVQAVLQGVSNGISMSPAWPVVRGTTGIRSWEDPLWRFARRHNWYKHQLGRNRPLVWPLEKELDMTLPSQEALLTDLIEKNSLSAVALDVLLYVWGDIESENDSVQVASACAALKRVAKKTGAAIIAIHHSRKGLSGGGAGDARESARGSSAISGMADVLASIRHEGDNNYALEIVPKDAGPSKWKISYSPDDPSPWTVTTLDEAMANEFQEAILHVVDGEWRSAEDLKGGSPEEKRPSISKKIQSVRDELNRLSAAGMVERREHTPEKGGKFFQYRLKQV